ncbi:hypothetical protein [Saccharibacillus sp. JS10]|uniref:hypothetical protein n=1 Tax=Saccharibacillus sp. JS10 TaxID=2950552 RepID=UPI00210C146D|nr:hypothetical protein [Saccharibacillus sp. JS10]MCQ4086031.1 hypothetical protein [Saccharibacillus sp. JS10]
MFEYCKCGQRFDLDFRLVDYKKQISIDNVPIVICPKCEHEEILPWVQQDLSLLLQSLPLENKSYGLDYTDFNELAYIIYKVFTSSEVDTKDAFKLEVQTVCAARINTLLDLYRCASDVHDQSWMAEIEARLLQLTQKVLSGENEIRFSWA